MASPPPDERERSGLGRHVLHPGSRGPAAGAAAPEHAAVTWQRLRRCGGGPTVDAMAKDVEAAEWTTSEWCPVCDRDVEVHWTRVIETAADGSVPIDYVHGFDDEQHEFSQP